MEALRDNFLSDAALPGDEDFGVGPCHTLDFLTHLHDLAADADQLRLSGLS
jgi:hypothetical protein